ncbi:MULTISPECIES: hypothetical protein [unclassified Corynebacterium]|uniref:hypothetical protein n=1 Tax=unclassified Corynebacterium TaxID=2624378 RepID=UPI003525ABC4
MSRSPIFHPTSTLLVVALTTLGFSGAACDFGRDPLLKTLDTHPYDVIPATLYDSDATAMTVICPHQPRSTVDEVLGEGPQKSIPETGLLEDSNAIGVVKPSGRTIIKRFARSKIDLCSGPAELRLYPPDTRATFEERSGTFTLVSLDPPTPGADRTGG